jgi:hypothetical protein
MEHCGQTKRQKRRLFKLAGVRSYKAVRPNVQQQQQQKRVIYVLLIASNNNELSLGGAAQCL